MAIDNKQKAYASSILFMVGIVVSLLFIEFTFAENPPTVEVSDPFPEDMEIKDVVAETNKPSSSSSAKNPIPKPTPPAPTNNNNSSEELTDNKPNDAVSNPFGGQNGGSNNSNGFGDGNTGDGKPDRLILSLLDPAGQLCTAPVFPERIGQPDGPGRGYKFETIFTKDPVCGGTCHIDIAPLNLIGQPQRGCRCLCDHTGWHKTGDGHSHKHP